MSVGHAHLLHEGSEVLLNVNGQVLDILVKQGLLLPGRKGFVVCPTLWVLAKLPSPILNTRSLHIRAALCVASHSYKLHVVHKRWVWSATLCMLAETTFSKSAMLQLYNALIVRRIAFV